MSEAEKISVDGVPIDLVDAQAREDISEIESNLIELNEKYLVTRSAVRVKTKTTLNNHNGTTFSNLFSVLPSLTIPTGYEIVSNVYIEASGFQGLIVSFDTISNSGNASNINGFAFNASNANLGTNTNIDLNFITIWKKSTS